MLCKHLRSKVCNKTWLNNFSLARKRRSTQARLAEGKKGCARKGAGNSALPAAAAVLMLPLAPSVDILLLLA